MYRVNLKPLSVNQVFKGKRFRTKEYDIYEPAAAQAAAKYELKPCFKTDSDLSANFEQNKLRKTTLK